MTRMLRPARITPLFCIYGRIAPAIIKVNNGWRKREGKTKRIHEKNSHCKKATFYSDAVKGGLFGLKIMFYVFCVEG